MDRFRRTLGQSLLSPVISTSGAVANNVTVNTSATLTISSGGDFTVAGNLVNNGTVNVSGNLIVN